MPTSRPMHPCHKFIRPGGKNWNYTNIHHRHFYGTSVTGSNSLSQEIVKYTITFPLILMYSALHILNSDVWYIGYQWNAITRSVSNSSNSIKETPERISIANASGYIIDSRSKTLNTVTHQFVKEETLKEQPRNTTITHSNFSPTPKGNGSGYGKTLLTSLHKPVLRELHFTSQNKNFNSSFHGKTMNVMKSVSLMHPRLEVATSILFHLIFWRFAHIASYVCPVPVQWLLLFTIIAVGVLFWTAVKGATGTKFTTNTVGKITPNEKMPKMPGLPKHSKLNASRLSNNQRIPGSNMKTVVDARHVESINYYAHRAPRSISGIQRSREQKKEGSFRDTINEKLKENFIKDMTSSNIGSPRSGIHSRTFKPQLEDIQSSNVLLNKKQELNNNAMDRGKEPESRPKTSIEEYRKQLLLESRRKFQSKQFWNDAKYDKIEGLNWISWK